MGSEEQAKVKDDIASAASTEAVIQTTGGGEVRESIGKPRTGTGDASAALDVAAAALDAAGPRLSMGAFRDAVITFDDGVLVLGREGTSSVFAVLAEPGASAGLLLNQVRRVLGSKPSDSSTPGRSSSRRGRE